MCARGKLRRLRRALGQHGPCEASRIRSAHSRTQTGSRSALHARSRLSSLGASLFFPRGVGCRADVGVGQPVVRGDSGTRGHRRVHMGGCNGAARQRCMKDRQRHRARALHNGAWPVSACYLAHVRVVQHFITEPASQQAHVSWRSRKYGGADEGEGTWHSE